ncbi:MAG: DUF2344 domain-containing protein [Peptococcaceae bacterium]|jgi:radical SAM-linked protein|nr:DUF2344 domain-containing protein [Peptococcaceae bacterium]
MSIFRCCYSIQGNISFLSHLDLLQAWQRILRRAKIPVAMSQGFNPHTKIAFGPARPVGVESLREYFDIELQQDMGIDVFTQRLSGALPEGICLEEVVPIQIGEKSITALIAVANYSVWVDERSIVGIEERIAALLDREDISYLKTSPKGDKTVNLRPGIFILAWDGEKFTMQLLAGNSGHVRPEEVLSCLGIGKEETKRTLRTDLLCADGTRP